MRFIILLSFLGLSLISQASGICDSNESVSLMSKNDKIILKCDCNCTNEENKFYINSINPIEALRLVSLDGISKITFDNLKNNKSYVSYVNWRVINHHMNII